MSGNVQAALLPSQQALAAIQEGYRNLESLRDLFPAPWGVKYSRERVYS